MSQEPISSNWEGAQGDGEETVASQGLRASDTL